MKNSENKNKVKKGLVMSVLSILLFVGLLAGVAYAVFTDNSIVGSWQIDSSNEEHRVLTFNSDNTVSLVIDTLQIDGTYELKGNNTININLEVSSQSVMKGDYNYIINSGLNGKTLDIKDSGNMSTKYKQYKKEQKKSDPNLKLDENLLGLWLDKEGNVEVTYEFKNDGSLTIKNKNLTMTLKYNLYDGKISFLQNVGENAQMSDLEYKIDGNNLTLGDLNLERKYN